MELYQLPVCVGANIVSACLQLPLLLLPPGCCYCHNKHILLLLVLYLSLWCSYPTTTLLVSMCILLLSSSQLHLKVIIVCSLLQHGLSWLLLLSPHWCSLCPYLWIVTFCLLSKMLAEAVASLSSVPCAVTVTANVTLPWLSIRYHDAIALLLAPCSLSHHSLLQLLLLLKNATTVTWCHWCHHLSCSQSYCSCYQQALLLAIIGTICHHHFLLACCLSPLLIACCPVELLLSLWLY